MAVKDIYTRKTIIPTSESVGTSRDSKAIQKVLQARGEKEQYQHYERQAIPIKDRVLTSIKNQITQKEQEIKNKQEKIKRLEEKERTSDGDYSDRIDEERDEINAIEKGLGVLRTELSKYEKITDPLEIVGYGDKYGSEVLRYAKDVERYEERDAKNYRNRIKQEKENMKKVEKEVKDQGGFIYQGIAFDKGGSVIGIVNKEGEKAYEDLMKLRSKLDGKPIIVEGKGLFSDGKFYPSTNKEWMEKKAKEIESEKYKIETPTSQVVPLPPDGKPIIAGTSTLGTITKTTPMEFIRDQNQTIEMKTTGKPGTTDITTIGTRPMTPEELKNNEQFNEMIKDKSFMEVFSMGNIKGRDFSWKGKGYDTDTAIEAMVYLTQQDLEKEAEFSLNPKLKNAENIYNEKVKNIENYYSNGQISYDEAQRRNELAFKEYEDYSNQAVKDFENKTATPLLEERQKLIDKFDYASKWKDALSAKKLIPTLAIGAGLGLASAGALGGTAMALATSTTAKAIGVGGLALSGAITGMQLYNLQTRGKLNLDSAMSIIGPQIIYLGVASVGALAGGYVGNIRFKKIEAEFRLNIKNQMLTDKLIQNKVFTKANMQRGYAEIKYRGYTMRVSSNEKLYMAIKQYNQIKTEGTITSTEFRGLDINQRLKVNDAIKKQLKSLKEDLYIYEEGSAIINQKTFTKLTGTQIKDRTIYSVNGRLNNKYVEFLFNMKKNGKITDLYIVTKQPTEIEGLFLARIGKVIRTPDISKIRVPNNANPLEVLSIKIQPVGWKLIAGKNIKNSVLNTDNLIFEKTLSAIMIKDLKGVARGGKVTFEEFVDLGNIIKIPKQSFGGETTGKLVTAGIKKVEPRNQFDKITEILTFGGKTTKTTPLFTTTSTKIPPKIISRAMKPFGDDTFGFGELSKSIGLKTVTKSTNTQDIFTKTPITPTKTTTTPKITTPESEWFGKGMYETTLFGGATTGALSMRKNTIDSNTNEFTSLSSRLGFKTSPVEKVKIQQKPSEVSILNWGLESLNKQKITQEPKTQEIQKDALSQNTKEFLQFGQLTRTAQLQRTQQLTRTPQLTKPTIDFPTWGFKKEKEKEKKKKQKEIKEDIWDWGFVAEVRRGGKFKPVSKIVSKKEAYLIGQDIVKNTLGATFRVRKADRKIKQKKTKDSFFGISEDFYKKKTKEGELFIEKREKRLSTKGERKEIQRARKKKSPWSLW